MMVTGGIFEEELLDPTPNIHDLFVHYQQVYFHNSLGNVSVEWSGSRMTQCGGICQKIPGGAMIKLSKPLLTLRPTFELKNTLLHEMIHAYHMVHNIRDDDPSGHGTKFKAYATSINTSTVVDHQRPSIGYNITIYHSMFDEVDYYRQHHWKCERCGEIVKRAMNRPPQDADCRSKAGMACADPYCKYHMHIKYCGGTYLKIKEPENYKKKRRKKEKTADATGAGDEHVTKEQKRKNAEGSLSIDDYFQRLQGKGRRVGTGNNKIKVDNDINTGRGNIQYMDNEIKDSDDPMLPSLDAIVNRPQATLRRGNSGTNSSAPRNTVNSTRNTAETDDDVIILISDTDEESTIGTDTETGHDDHASIQCPVCGMQLFIDSGDTSGAMNAHLDECLNNDDVL